MKYLYALIAFGAAAALAGHFSAPPLVALITVIGTPMLVLRFGPKP